MARLFKIRLYDFLRVSLCIITTFSQKLGRPKSKKLVAPRFGLELHFRVMGEFAFECVLAFVECGHRALPCCALSRPL